MLLHPMLRVKHTAILSMDMAPPLPLATATPATSAEPAKALLTNACSTPPDAWSSAGVLQM